MLPRVCLQPPVLLVLSALPAEAYALSHYSLSFSYTTKLTLRALASLLSYRPRYSSTSWIIMPGGLITLSKIKLIIFLSLRVLQGSLSRHIQCQVVTHHPHPSGKRLGETSLTSLLPVMALGQLGSCPWLFQSPSTSLHRRACQMQAVKALSLCLHSSSSQPSSFCTPLLHLHPVKHG